jgi:hypothetical protein
MSEVSLRWHLNSIRNPLYLMLKHYGLFGKGGAALRLTFLQHVGLISAVRHPSRGNWAYLANGLRARASAYWHWLKYLLGPRFDSPGRFKRLLDADERTASSGVDVCGAAAPRSG